MKTHKSRNKSKTNNKNYVNEIRVKVLEFKRQHKQINMGRMLYIDILSGVKRKKYSKISSIIV